jgi:hypothetical protein
MVMDFSWDWVKPGSVMTTEPLAKARPEPAPRAMELVAHGPAVGNRLALETLDQGSPARLAYLALRA